MTWKDGHARHRGRQDRLIRELVHDPYLARSKPKEPTVCPDCGVVFAEGRWQWLAELPEGAHSEMCPACRRVHDKVPAGYLHLGGEFFRAHRDEILRLVHNKVEYENSQHPMKRLMAVEDDDDGALLTFTDMHLPRGAGDAIRDAYEGELEIQDARDAGNVRVYWRR